MARGGTLLAAAVAVAAAAATGSTRQTLDAMNSLTWIWESNKTNALVDGFTVLCDGQLPACNETEITFKDPVYVNEAAFSSDVTVSDGIAVISNAKMLNVTDLAVAVAAPNSGVQNITVSATTLMVLDLSHNQITSLPAGFLGSPRTIYYFDISFNVLQTVHLIWGPVVPRLLNLSFSKVCTFSFLDPPLFFVLFYLMLMRCVAA